MKKYEVFRKGNDPGKDIGKYSVAVATLVEKLPTGLQYEWKRRGQAEWRTEDSKPELRAALLERRLKVGEAFYARRKGGTAVYVLRAIEVLSIPDYPDPLGTPGIRALWEVAWTAFRDLGPGYEFVFMGAFVCRRIDGSTRWSQHAFHKAFDFRIRKAEADASSIDDEATTKVANAVAAHTCEVLWHSPGHTYHAHVTDCPKATGTPSCA